MKIAELNKYMVETEGVFGLEKSFNGRETEMQHHKDKMLI